MSTAQINPDFVPVLEPLGQGAGTSSSPPVSTMPTRSASLPRRHSPDSASMNSITDSRSTSATVWSSTTRRSARTSGWSTGLRTSAFSNLTNESPFPP